MLRTGDDGLEEWNQGGMSEMDEFPYWVSMIEIGCPNKGEGHPEPKEERGFRCGAGSLGALIGLGHYPRRLGGEWC